jgi:Fe2+ transport system protein FeoA
MAQLISLRNVPPGRQAVIAEVAGDPLHAKRLHDLGLSQGTSFEVVRQGNPCIIRFSGTKLCFRENESANVKVILATPL